MTSAELLTLALLRKPASLNQTEGRYFDHLVYERSRGEVLEFLPHAVTLTLGPDCRYTPDFLVVVKAYLNGARVGVLELHEVKGPYIRAGDDGLVKLRAAAARFPWLRFRLAQEQRDKSWAVREVHP